MYQDVLTSAVNEGYFTTILQANAILYGANALQSATTSLVVFATSAPTASPVKSNSPSASPNSHKKNKLSGGAIAGIVIGVVVFVALLIALIYYFVRRNLSESGSLNLSSSSFLDVNPSKLEAQPAPANTSTSLVEERAASVVVF